MSLTPKETRRLLKELAAALKAEPGSIPKRLELAAALREAGRPVEAIDLYRGVAAAYAEDGRLVQAMAVCKGIIDIDAAHRDTLEMLATLAQRRAARDATPGGGRRLDSWGEITSPTVADRPPSRTRRSDFNDENTQPDHAGPPPPPVPDGLIWGNEEITKPGDGDGDAEAARRQRNRPASNDSGSWVATPVGHGDSLIPRPLPEGAEVPERHGSMRPTLREAPVARPPLDFPEEAKRLARGSRLMELTPAPGDTQPFSRDALAELEAETTDAQGTVAATPRARESERNLVPPPPPASGDTDPHIVDDTMRPTNPRGMPAVRLAHDLADGQAADPSFFDEDGAIADVLTAPFPRPPLLVEPPPFPLLSDLPRSAFMELLARLTVVRCDAGAVILNEGQAGDACYLIASGTVRVVKAGLEVALLGAGSFFGEFAVLSDQRRHASVEAVEPVELLEITRALLDELVAAHPGVARTLRTFYRERLLHTLLATAPFFAPLSPTERAAISERFRPRRFGRGAQIIEEGSPGGGLYLILVGEVEVVRGAGADQVMLGRLGEGSYFGEMSLLHGGVASATVRAARMTEAVQLPPRDFYEMASHHPVLWEELRSEAERRELANHAIVAGEARQSEDGSIYLV